MRLKLDLRDWIGIGLIFAFINVLFALMFKDIPKANEQLIVYMLGQLSGFVATVVGYHFVTSSSDHARTVNTGKMADAMKAVAESSQVSSDQATGKPEDPVHTVQE